MCVHVYIYIHMYIYIYMYDMTHSSVWNDSDVCVTRPSHICNMTHPYVWHDACISVKWLIRTFDMSHLCDWHGPVMCVTWSHVCRIRMCDMTYSRQRRIQCVTAHALQNVAACCSTSMCDMTYSQLSRQRPIHCVAEHELQCAAVCCSTSYVWHDLFRRAGQRHSMLQHLCCNMLQCLAAPRACDITCHMSTRDETTVDSVCCSTCVAVYCSVLQHLVCVT